MGQDSVSFRPLPLPEGVSEFAAHAQADSGELFLATVDDLFIRSPFGDPNGWERVGELQVDDDRIVSLVCCRTPAGDALLVAAENQVFVVTWKHREQASHRWGRFRYAFRVDRLQKHGFWGAHARLYAFTRDADGTAVRGWVATSSSELVPVVTAESGLEFGQPIDLNGGYGTSSEVFFENSTPYNCDSHFRPPLHFAVRRALSPWSSQDGTYS